MNRRTRNAITYHCDRPGCNGRHIAPYTDFKLAWTHAKAAGWLTAKEPLSGKWFHFCTWVHRPNDRQLGELVSQKQELR